MTDNPKTEQDGVWLPQDEFDALCEKANRAEQAERELRETDGTNHRWFLAHRKLEEELEQAKREIADLRAKLGVQQAVASVADDALLSRRRR